MCFYTYIHTRADDLKVFYVGKGADKRAYKTNRRSAYWKKVVAKHGYTIDICARFTTEAEAFEHERFLIVCFRGLHAPLVNLTDGGEGASGVSQSAATRAKRAASTRGKKRSEETRRRMSVAATGRVMSAAAVAKSAAANIGRKLSAEHIAKVSAALKGRTQTAEVIENRVKKLRGLKRSPEFRAACVERERLKREKAAAYAV